MHFYGPVARLMEKVEWIIKRETKSGINIISNLAKKQMFIKSFKSQIQDSSTQFLCFLLILRPPI